MADSVGLVSLDDVTDESAVQTALQSWLTTNTPTSVAGTDFVKIGRKRGYAVIWYTA